MIRSRTELQAVTELPSARLNHLARMIMNPRETGGFLLRSDKAFPVFYSRQGARHAKIYYRRGAEAQRFLI